MSTCEENRCHMEACLPSFLCHCPYLIGEDMNCNSPWTHGTLSIERILSTHGLPLVKLLLENF